MIPGAVGGLDILSAVKLSGLGHVVYTSRKPPSAWRGTPAEQTVDLDGLTKAHVFFEGDAAQAATAFPQNANVAATIALKGAGFAATKVQLIADPEVSGNVHELTVSGNSADFTAVCGGEDKWLNPGTCWLLPKNFSDGFTNSQMLQQKQQVISAILSLTSLHLSLACICHFDIQFG